MVKALNPEPPMPSQSKTNLNNCETLLPFLRVVSNTTRLKILCLLLEGERCVGDINKLLGAKQSYISQQLKVLRKVAYLKNRREGVKVYYRMANEKVGEVLKYLIGVWVG